MLVEDKRYVWSGDQIAVERDAMGLVVRQFYGQGMRIAQGLQAGSYYYARDHLGSIRELVDGVGATRARYAYSPFGSRTKVAGDVSSEFGFTGLPQQDASLLAFARYRAYDAQLGRWMSRDSLGEWAGTKKLNPLFGTWVAPNLFLYVGSDPANFVDPTGQQAAIPWGPIFGGAAAGAAVGGAVGAFAGAVLVCFFVPGDTPQPDDAECDKQWSDAYKKCAELITSKQTPEVKRLRGKRHGKPYNLDECARGHVSAVCGGNPI
jgi:RHS repeat-associated protein